MRAQKIFFLFSTLLCVSALAVAGDSEADTGSETQKKEEPKLLAPYAFEQAFSKEEHELYSLFTAVDTTAYANNNPPNTPSNPSPGDGSTGAPTTGATLTWQGGDPDPGDTVTYNVTFDDTPNPQTLECASATTEQCQIQRTLTDGVTYYWRVVAEDSSGLVTSGPVWSFTVGGGAATPTPIPTPLPPTLNALDASTTSTSVNLSWTSVALADEYQVEWSNEANFSRITGSSGWQTGQTHMATGLKEGAPLYFRAQARNVSGTSGFSNVESTIVDISKPYIYLAGYLNTFVTVANGGTLTMLAYCEDNVGVAEVELYFGGQPTGVTLAPDGAGVFTASIPIPPGSVPSPQQLALEFVATDNAGNPSDLWPYLTINDGAPAPAPGAKIANQLAASPIEGWELLQRRLVDGEILSRNANPQGAPEILAGGYWDTDLTTTDGGKLTVVVAISDPVQSVEIYTGGQASGIFLLDNGAQGDLASGDNLYTFTADIGPLEPGLAGQQLLLEVVARNPQGLTSATFPYFAVNN